jgi:hypothetical protein
MAQLDPKRKKIFEEKVIDYVRKFESLTPAQMKAKLSDFAVLKLPLQGKSFRGEKEIGKFCDRAKKDGLTKVEFKFNPDKIRIWPADFLLRKGDCYYRFDMIAEVHGKCNLIIKENGRLTDPLVPFVMTSGHQWECPFWPLEISLGV